jgi:aminoglycoside 3-N-acetyltransferase
MAASADGLTADELAQDLRALGVTAGATLMAHSSLSAIGCVAGGPQTVIRALLSALGPDGTLVLPTFRDGVYLEGLHKTAPPGKLAQARALPVFDPDTTPTNMGAIPDAFRRWPGVIRSAHPFVSVCCLGPKSREIAEPHDLEWGQGTNSPFERLHAMDAQLLLLGVGFNRLTMLHYAEQLVEGGRRKTRITPTPAGIVLTPDIGNDMDTHFPLIGEGFMATGSAQKGRIGAAGSVLMTARPVVDFAHRYLETVFGGATAPRSLLLGPSASRRCPIQPMRPV